MKIDTVHNKSCQRMDELPDDSVDMALSSPPYWGLRDYGEDVKEIWGGDRDCEHEWNSVPIGGRNKRPEDDDPKFAKGLSNPQGKSNLCQKCNAWHGQLGLEPTFQLYLDHMMIVCAEIKRALKKTGSFWLNMGDTYAGGGGGNYGTGLSVIQKEKGLSHLTNIRNRQEWLERNKLQAKCLVGIPWRLVLRLIDEQGWILRNAIIWNKPNAMPSSVKDRCSNSYEHLFHLVKAKKYYYDLDAIRERHKPTTIERQKYPVKANTQSGTLEKGRQLDKERIMKIPNPAGKNPGDVWTIATQPRPEAHFATFPDALCIKPILATCPQEICKKCGKARVRITQKPDMSKRPKRSSVAKTFEDKHLGFKERSAGQKYQEWRNKNPDITIGWTDCGCGEGFDSGVLLDPFAGRGTALIMAKKLGRHYVGYELKKEYVEKLIEPALEEIDPLFRKEL